MIKYGKILKMHEKDNPSPFCRASYLISNVGDMVKCYGRMLRFPDDAHIYQKEMELAMGDVIMQCRLIQVENNKKESNPTYKAKHNDMINGKKGTIESLIGEVVLHAALIAHTKYARERSSPNDILEKIYLICEQMGTDFNTIQHLGFIHTIERFKEFERRGWQ